MPHEPMHNLVKDFIDLKLSARARYTSLSPRLHWLRELPVWANVRVVTCLKVRASPLQSVCEGTKERASYPQVSRSYSGLLKLPPEFKSW